MKEGSETARAVAPTVPLEENSAAFLRWTRRALQGLIVVALVFAPLATGAVRGRDFLLLQALAATGLFFWAARRISGGMAGLRFSLLDGLVLTFVIFATVRSAFVDIPYVARQEWIKVVVGGAFYFIARDVFRSGRSCWRALEVMLGVAAAVSGYAVWQWLTGSDRVWHFHRPEVYAGRGSGTYISPDHLAGWLVLLFPLSVCRFNLCGGSRPGRWLWGGVSVAMAAGLTATASLSGLLAGGVAAASLAAWAWKSLAWRGAWMASLAAVIFLLRFLPVAAFPAPERVSVVGVSEGSAGSRWGWFVEVRRLIWGPAFEMWRDHAWWGVGPAHFDYRFREYRSTELQARPDRVHNDFLNTLVDWGLVGAMIVAAVIIEGFRTVRSGMAREGGQPGPHWVFSAGAGFGLLGALLDSFMEFNAHIPANALLAVVLLGMVGGTQVVRGPDRRKGWAGGRKWLPAGLACLAGMALLCAGGRWLVEQRWLAEGASPTDATERETALRRAFASAPLNFETAYQIGELLRLRSWGGGADHRLLAEEAMLWFERAMEGNPHDSQSRFRYGMCLHWLRRHEEAATFFEEGLRLDPNGYHAAAMMGWHLLQDGDLDGSEQWFRRSMEILPAPPNTFAASYLEIIQQARERGAGGERW